MMRRLLYLAAVPFSILFATILHPGMVQAQAAPFARPEFFGYFNGAETPGHVGDDIFNGGVGTIMDIDAFVQLYHDNLYTNTDPRSEIGAAFTILTMLGYPAGTSWIVARDPNVFSTWETTVRYYQSQGWIGWNDNYPYNYNTLYFFEPVKGGDVAWYGNKDTRPSIVFYNPGGTTSYAIKRDCANPVGDMVPLTRKPSIQLQCGNMLPVVPPRPEINDTVTVTVTVNYTNGPPRGAPTGQITVSGIGPVPMQSITRSGGSSGTFTMVSSFPVRNVGTYTVGWTLSVDGVPPVSCGGDVSVPNNNFDVSNYPYFNAIGGDVAAGARFATDVGGSCGSSNTNAGIAGWNKNSPSWNGASGQYGLFAFNYIQDIISSKGNNNGGSMTTLSFANEGTGNPNSVTPSSGLFGGFTKEGPCIDYWADKPTSGGNSIPNVATINLSTMSNGVYVVNGTGAKLTISDTSGLPNGARITIYVEGDVNIASDITYANTSWSSPSDIPIFKLVAKGNIFIDSTVGEIDGNIIAVPDAGYDSTTNNNDFTPRLRGTISTCSNGFSILSPAASMIGTCNHTLKFYGTVAANQIFLLRTYGTMNNATPAEQFNLSPEDWLAPDSNNSIDPAYKSIVGLPPVL